jgi:AcrR family transcriptional regulator
MDRKRAYVKPSRRYDSTRRRQGALQTRVTILDAAERLFLDQGYAGTTIASIAGAALVSVETIYKAFGSKAGLVRELWRRGLEGSGPVPAEERSDEMQLREHDTAAVIRNWGTLMAEVAPRGAPIASLIGAAAATDPEMSTLIEEVDATRLERMELNARRLMEHGGLRDGLTLQDVRDVLWTYSSAELYDLLVVRRGWSADRFGRFAAEGMAAALLPRDPAGDTSAAAADVSGTGARRRRSRSGR